MKKILYLALCLMFFVGYSCKEESLLDYTDGSVPAPAPVTVDKVTNKPGGAVIKYTIPNDENLLGVKAVYERNGEICETKASLYSDTLIVEGLGEAKTYDVELFSVGRNEKLSSPVKVEINPLIPPVHTVNFDLEATFGGVNLLLSGNDLNASFAVVVLIDSLGLGEWLPLHTFYTKAETIKLSRRGLDVKEYQFAVYLRDRWLNRSDTIYRTLTPIEEVKLSKDSYTNARLPGDSYDPAENNGGYTLEHLWDGLEGVGWYNTFFANQFTSPMPQQFTISLGYKASISRFKMWPRADDMYSSSTPRTWELWGSDNPPADGSYDNWCLLGEFSQFKPSGYGDGNVVGTITDEDRTYFQSGGDYELEITDNAIDPFRTVSFLRFRTTATFTTYGTEARTGQLIIGELTFWGQVKE
jgi:hypothetical protein